MEKKEKKENESIQLGWIILVGVVVLGGIAVIAIAYSEPEKGIRTTSSHICSKTKLPKIGYNSLAKANLKALWDSIKHNTDMVTYKCPFCGKFHLGHRHVF